MAKIKDLLKVPLASLINKSVRSSTIRNISLKKLEQRVYKFYIKNSDNRPLKVQEDKFNMARALFNSINRAIGDGRLSSENSKALVETLVSNILSGGDTEAKKAFEKEFGYLPPYFLTISPTKSCNLKCVGCYANSEFTPEKLDFDIVDRIIQEKKELWGSHFTVISGGEPLLYKSKGKGILDIASKHKDNYFLMYTNGTLINELMAKKLAKVSNITPAISVEGFEEETDRRRGSGVYKKILGAFAHLRKAGVPFGISITVTKDNADLIMSDKLFDFYFKEHGVIYAWIFHYMPIGRKFTLDIMPTPEQRVKLFRRVQEIVRDRRIFVADFWNSGAVADGCISAGRVKGYLYIDWNGNVCPCVFAPYSSHNIVEVYRTGGNLNTILNSDFFRAIRKWQDDYAYKQPADKTGNLIRTCPIRDHYGMFHELLKLHNPFPIDKNADIALKDEEYRKGLIAYGEKIEELTKDIWEKECLQSGGLSTYFR